MSDSTSPLDLITAAQSSKEVTANELFNSASPALLYARRASTSTALTWGFYGGRYNGTAIASGTVALTANTTNYVVALRSTGAVSTSTATTNWNDTSNYLRLYQVVTGASTVTSYQDHRNGTPPPASGNAVLVAGTVTVNCAAVTATSVIQLTPQADGGTPGWHRITARTAGTSFTITSSSGSDTSTIGWTLHQP